MDFWRFQGILRNFKGVSLILLHFEEFSEILRYFERLNGFQGLFDYFKMFSGILRDLRDCIIYMEFSGILVDLIWFLRISRGSN